MDGTVDSGEGLINDEVPAATNSSTGRRNLPQAVKNLGRKARASLEQERRKRREVQRVEVFLPDAERVHGHLSVLVDAVKLEAKKKSSAAKKRRRTFECKVDGFVDDRNVDRWMPDISHIAQPTSKENRSSVVQIHGLPQGTTPGRIRRFFSGLDPMRIFLFPSTKALLRDLDAQFDIPRKCGFRVDRHECQLRVFVKFQSAPTAALAAQRSGEVLQVSNSTGASIAVSHLLKSTGTYFVKMLAIDVDPDLPIETTLHKIDASVDPSVPVILWGAAIKDLKLNVDSDFRQSKYYSDERRFVPRKPKLVCDVTELQRERVTMQHEVDRLMNSLPFPAAESLDPTLLLSTPIVNLTSTCVRIIQNDIERIDSALAIVARWTFLASTRPPCTAKL